MVGAHPWNVPPPGIVYDMSAAGRELGYEPATSYAVAVVETVDWLVKATSGHDWQSVFRDARYLTPLFDYAAEDAYIAHV